MIRLAHVDKFKMGAGLGAGLGAELSVCVGRAISGFFSSGGYAAKNESCANAGTDFGSGFGSGSHCSTIARSAYLFEHIGLTTCLGLFNAGAAIGGFEMTTLALQ